MNVGQRTGRPGTRLIWPFRAWFAAEVFFGVAALLSIGRFPAETATRWAWPIEPVVTAAVLAGFYVALTPVVILALVARRWEMVRVVVPAATAFTFLELVATFLHWDRFSVGTLPFYVWFASYLLPPPIFVAMYIWQQRRAAPMSHERPLPRALRGLLLVLGGLLAAEAVVAFVFPAWFMSSFPWQLTPLTTRVLCGWLIAVGTVMVTIAVENHRDRVRLATPFLILVLPALGVQVARFSDQVDLSHFRIWLGLLLFGVVSACGLYLARGSWRESLR